MNRTIPKHATSTLDIALICGATRVNQCVAWWAQLFIHIIVFVEKVLSKLVLAVELAITEQASQHHRPLTLVPVASQAALVSIGHSALCTTKRLAGLWLWALCGQTRISHHKGQGLNVGRCQVREGNAACPRWQWFLCSLPSGGSERLATWTRFLFDMYRCWVPCCIRCCGSCTAKKYV